MKSPRLYLDHNATTALKPDVLALMRAVLGETGNASSVHQEGRSARSHVEAARQQVAGLAGVNAAQVTLTGGATESNNAVLKAFAGQRILVSAIEHPSVLESAPQAERLPVTKSGVVDQAAFEEIIAKGPPPALISVMMVNSETGAIQPVETLARAAKKRHPSVHFHTDAAQAAGRIPLDFAALQLDYLSLSAHKMGGPQGAGALICAPGAHPARLLHGGGQEKRQRAGTENVAALAGFGLAAELARQDMAAFQKLAALRDKMEREIRRLSAAAVIFAQDAPRVANTSCFALPGVPAQTRLMALDLAGVAVSSGSACSSGTVKASTVLQAMGAAPAESESALRVSLGWSTTAAEIDSFLTIWSKMVTS